MQLPPLLDCWLLWVGSLPFTGLAETSCTWKAFPDGCCIEMNDFCKTDALTKEVKRVLVKLQPACQTFSFHCCSCLQRIKSVSFTTSVMIWHCVGHVTFASHFWLIKCLSSKLQKNHSNIERMFMYVLYSDITWAMTSCTQRMKVLAGSN